MTVTVEVGRFEGPCCGGPYDSKWLLQGTEVVLVWGQYREKIECLGSYRHWCGVWLWEASSHSRVRRVPKR